MSDCTKRVLVTGATGLLGRAVMREFAISGLYTSGTAFRRTATNCHKIDLTDIGNIAPFLDWSSPDVIIHAAAERRPDISEKDPEGTWNLNVLATEAIAEWCDRRSRKMILVSTDYVFDGSAPPYCESDSPNPLNTYGRSKRAAEEAALRTNETSGTTAILRVPILFGDTDNLAESAVTTLALQMLSASRSEELLFDNISTRYPTNTADVAKILRQMVEHDALSGIFHWTSETAMTKYQMALAMRPFLAIDPSIRISPDNSPPVGAPRPGNTHLVCNRLRTLGISTAETGLTAWFAASRFNRTAH